MSAALGIVAGVLRVVGEWEGVVYKYGIKERGGRAEIRGSGQFGGGGGGGGRV